MNMSPGGWNGYSQSPTQQWVQNAPNPQYQFGQNGGQMMQQSQDTPFVGRYINQIEEVMPREVPMDGRVGIFPTQSLEEIYLKFWDRSGTIKTIRYILDPLQMQGMTMQSAAQQPDMSSKILERLEQIEQRLGEQPKNTNRRNNSKGGDENA